MCHQSDHVHPVVNVGHC